ncbi:FKBP-type peptidyl-prolyl cis-trans isomerase [Rodentibacter caecimuris]|uniref:Peptidyl-prolyl cis-trans isomerase n=1 Tax=Rodentibacter caecimuris TaxID=1796644 RepID=A0ABX3KZM8_9PAST|nr:peptidylprolyl isomerase [Rodentibacter heylii]
MTATFFQQITLDDISAKGSYGIGLQIGQQLIDSQLAVKAEAVAKGIYDALNQNPPILDLNDVSQALHQLQQQAAEQAKIQFEKVKEEGNQYLTKNAQKDGVKITNSGLQYEVLTEGNGAVPNHQDKVRVHYTGTLIDGTVFDSSVKRGQPAEFPVNGVIAGWVEALSMMPVGSKWRLVIPYSLAYGERGAGASIPPFATLIFEVELLEIL